VRRVYEIPINTNDRQKNTVLTILLGIEYLDLPIPLWNTQSLNDKTESKMRDCVAEYTKLLKHTHAQIMLTRRTNNRISQSIAWAIITYGTL